MNMGMGYRVYEHGEQVDVHDRDVVCTMVVDAVRHQHPGHPHLIHQKHQQNHLTYTYLKSGNQGPSQYRSLGPHHCLPIPHRPLLSSTVGPTAAAVVLLSNALIAVTSTGAAVYSTHPMGTYIHKCTIFIIAALLRACGWVGGWGCVLHCRACSTHMDTHCNKTHSTATL